ncbi:DUF1348 family protein [Mucilaginibacter pocheonensis]|uniref:Nuclear transport factor 2 (NTF2) superfamily protein n=1 Tax=Mucilaginibacter pocheonensis TaxID=398050 RepID=A0ABU1TAS4_9SPHI|nr:DUF1348 family protein [Mucilaginibacter pocheonensis]MDR6942505.1 nuclear transport factor 2 (NTF2) superfamily protein [Mucilaginibacter pocheonensis]
MTKHDLSMSDQAGDNDLCLMKTEKTLPTPPWDMETAAKRLQMLEDDFNTSDPERVIANYTQDAEVRFGVAFLKGRQEIRDFLRQEWQTKGNYKLKLDLWGALKGRMAVRSELEWSDQEGQSFKTYGVQVFQFNDTGFIEMNYLSFNDLEIG